MFTKKNVWPSRGCEQKRLGPPQFEKILLANLPCEAPAHPPKLNTYLPVMELKHKTYTGAIVIPVIM